MRIEDFEIRKLGRDTCSVVQYKGDDENLVIPPVIGKYRPVNIEPTLLRRGNPVRTLSIPSSVETIDDGLFPALKNIEAVNVEKASPSFSSEDGVLYDGSRYSLLFYPPQRKEENYTAPSRLGRVARSAFCCKAHFRTFSHHSRLEEFQVFPSECPELEAFISLDGDDHDGVLIKGHRLLFYPPRRDGHSYSVPDGIEEIAANSTEPFFPPSVKTVFVPASLRKGLENALGNAVKVDVDDRSRFYRSVDGVLYSWQRVLLAYPGRRAEDVYMPPSGTDRIGEGAFRGAAIRTLILSSGVTAIGNSAFENSDISVLVIPSSVTDIGVHALYGARKLCKVIVEKGSVGEIFLRGEGRDDMISVIPSLF